MNARESRDMHRELFQASLDEVVRQSWTLQKDMKLYGSVSAGAVHALVNTTMAMKENLLRMETLNPFVREADAPEAPHE